MRAVRHPLPQGASNASAPSIRTGDSDVLRAPRLPPAGRGPAGPFRADRSRRRPGRRHTARLRGAGRSRPAAATEPDRQPAGAAKAEQDAAAAEVGRIRGLVAAAEAELEKTGVLAE